ncbi:MAG: hypothetical protein JNK75_04660 [Betaproteobacteria bacterium]|nr:hypothetical protein [Betaproteobacteria bacterium]
MALLAAISQAPYALACSCAPLEILFSDHPVPKHVLATRSYSLVYGRPKASSRGEPVELEVFQHFYGEPVTEVAAVDKPVSACGTVLQAFKTRVFLVNGGFVSYCGNLFPDAKLLAYLQARFKSK